MVDQKEVNFSRGAHSTNRCGILQIMNDNEDHHQVSVDKDSSQENMVDSISPFVASVNDEDGSNEVGQVYCVFKNSIF
jgi:hypothetical protein